jgi:hypothetical protein
MPKETMISLSSMVENAKENWEIYGWRNEARAILSFGIKHKSNEIRVIAEKAINRLGARGFLEFGELLSDAQRPA